MILRVYLNAFGQRYFVGLLKEVGHRIAFEYDQAFLKRGISLSPFILPLKSGIFEDKDRTFDGLFGLFNDSLPDGWGCLLLNRALKKRGVGIASITPLLRLSMAGCNAMGALEYEPDESCAEDCKNTIELDEIHRETEHILQSESVQYAEELLRLSGSSGGARPKILAMVSDDKKRIFGNYACAEGCEPWIIKFASSQDRKNIGAIEYAYSLMAQKAGVDMPETYLFESSACQGHFGVKRFDRRLGEKLHMHTACGLLHASHRYPSIDYSDLLKLTHLLTRDIREVEKMARLMIFNVKSGNKDDHSKNFSFLMEQNGIWKLSPAYDLTPSEGINGEQTSLVNGKGNDIGFMDFVAVTATFGISEQRIAEFCERTDDALAEYPKLAKELGI